MSEATIPFQSTSVLDEPPLPDEFGEAAGNRRTVLVLVALGGLALLGLAAYFLLFAGGDSTSSAAAPPASTAPKPAASAPAADKPYVLPKLSAKNYGTDPFKPLIQDVAAAPAAGTTGTTTGGTTTAPTGTTTTTTTGGGTTTGTTTGTTSPVASASRTFQVVSVAANNSSITVKIDGKVYKNLRAGEVFATIFKVRFIGGAVTSFQIGDEVFNVAGTKKISISS